MRIDINEYFCGEILLFKMKIGFDAKRAVCNNTGLGNYSRLVIDVLSLYFPKNDYRLYSPVDRKNDRLEPLLMSVRWKKPS